MKQISLFILLLGLGCVTSMAQQRIYQLKAGYRLEGVTNHGAFLGVQMQKETEHPVSFPLGLQISAFSRDSYKVIALEAREGWERKFPGGFTVGQYLGIGAGAHSFSPGSIWYYDNFGNVVGYRDKWYVGAMASLGAQLKYRITENVGLQVNPVVYWDFLVRGLNLPYGAVQFGLTYQIKGRK